jgi:hypothetical protein
MQAPHLDHIKEETPNTSVVAPTGLSSDPLVHASGDQSAMTSHLSQGLWLNMFLRPTPIAFTPDLVSLTPALYLESALCFDSPVLEQTCAGVH